MVIKQQNCLEMIYQRAQQQQATFPFFIFSESISLFMSIIGQITLLLIQLDDNRFSEPIKENTGNFKFSSQYIQSSALVIPFTPTPTLQRTFPDLIEAVQYIISGLEY
ncbi:transmembrane protein, putative (macronuclear) [Tetrahymena thermophila SB210]|uniref:Transmembrane protein, putative n=1 Tax=Tetrahymena thermophila (strain SB210) TaxID=312017 RepID=W7X706_TETTS|nr:transmembrane protein, putative [Tetrahymena thermophila SB210]EWS75165.1 transmembrane protein, putative [Tetrahymena thermophila SB210]|eukprot:XP_012652321.1 transmembrane protein, putative [Tetrahymena thermophila SB210]